MPSTTNSSVDHVVADAELVSHLSAALSVAQRELEELEPRRVALTARVTALTHTIAVLKGETSAQLRKPRRSTGTRRARKSATPAPEATS